MIFTVTGSSVVIQSGKHHLIKYCQITRLFLMDNINKSKSSNLLINFRRLWTSMEGHGLQLAIYDHL